MVCSLSCMPTTAASTTAEWERRRDSNTLGDTSYIQKLIRLLIWTNHLEEGSIVKRHLKKNSGITAKGSRKKTVIFLMELPLRGVGEGMSLISNKFFVYLFLCCHLIIKKLSTYGNVTLNFVGRYFYWFVTIFAKKYGPYSPKIEKSCQIPHTKKNSDCHWARGGGLMALSLRK